MSSDQTPKYPNNVEYLSKIRPDYWTINELKRNANELTKELEELGFEDCRCSNSVMTIQTIMTQLEDEERLRSNVIYDAFGRRECSENMLESLVETGFIYERTGLNGGTIYGLNAVQALEIYETPEIF